MQLRYIAALLFAALTPNLAQADESNTDDFDIYIKRFTESNCDYPADSPWRVLIPGDTCHIFDYPFHSFYFEWAPRADSEEGMRHELFALRRLNCSMDIWAGRKCGSEFIGTKGQLNTHWVMKDCIYVPWDLPGIKSLSVQCEAPETEEEYGM